MSREINELTNYQHTGVDLSVLHDEKAVGFHTRYYNTKKGAHAYALRPV
jgi:hypothetical protein